MCSTAPQISIRAGGDATDTYHAIISLTCTYEYAHLCPAVGYLWVT